MRVNQQSVNAQVQGAEVAKTKQGDHAKAKDAAARAGATSVSTAIPGSVKTEISGKAKDMAQAKAVASNTSDVREDKVAALKAKIAAGTYKVDAEKIAERMFDDHAAMGAAGIG